MKKSIYFILIVISMFFMFEFSSMETKNNSNTIIKNNLNNLLAVNGNCTFTPNVITLDPNKKTQNSSIVVSGDCGPTNSQTINGNFENNYFKCTFDGLNLIQAAGTDAIGNYSPAMYQLTYKCTSKGKTPTSDVIEEYTVTYKQDTSKIITIGSFKVQMLSPNSTIDPNNNGTSTGNCSSSANSCNECKDRTLCGKMTIKGGALTCSWDDSVNVCENNANMVDDPKDPDSYIYDGVTITAYYNMASKKVVFSINANEAKITKIWVEDKDNKLNNNIVYSGSAIGFKDVKKELDVSSWENGTYHLTIYYESEYGVKKSLYNGTDREPYTVVIRKIKIDNSVTINDSSSSCNAVLSGFADTLSDILKATRIIAPIIVLAFSTIEYVTAVVSKDAEKLKVANSRLIKRVILMAVLFFLPTIVNLLIKLTLGSQYGNCVE